MGLPIIASFWAGGALSYLEQLCLRSFVIHGHRVVLYSYDAPKTCPDGVELFDAERIFPRAEFKGHEASSAPWVQGDIFKYHLLSLQNVTWVGLDMLCLRPWEDDADFLMGWEKPGKQISSAVLRLPRFSRALAQLNGFFASPTPALPWAEDATPLPAQEVNWGLHGPAALNYFLDKTGEIAHARGPESFCALPFRDRRKLLDANATIDIPPDAYGLQIWSRRLSRRIITHEGGLPAAGSYLERALETHGIDAQAAPIPDQPPEGSPTQEAIPMPKRKAPLADILGTPKPIDCQSGPQLMAPMESPPFQQAIDNLEARTSNKSPMLPPALEPISHDNVLILTSMKNEAPFILESPRDCYTRRQSLGSGLYQEAAACRTCRCDGARCV